MLRRATSVCRETFDMGLCSPRGGSRLGAGFRRSRQGSHQTTMIYALFDRHFVRRSIVGRPLIDLQVASKTVLELNFHYLVDDFLDGSGKQAENAVVYLAKIFAIGSDTTSETAIFERIVIPEEPG